MSLPLDALALHQSAGLSQLAGASQGVAHLPPSGKGRNRELLCPGSCVHTPNKVHGAGFLKHSHLLKLTLKEICHVMVFIMRYYHHIRWWYIAAQNSRARLSPLHLLLRWGPDAS